MIDLYGQCVQISIHDEDYRGSQVMPVPGEQTTTEPILVTVQEPASKSEYKFSLMRGISFFQWFSEYFTLLNKNMLFTHVHTCCGDFNLRFHVNIVEEQ